jgi:hypothetical protein
MHTKTTDAWATALELDERERRDAVLRAEPVRLAVPQKRRDDGRTFLVVLEPATYARSRSSSPASGGPVET